LRVESSGAEPLVPEVQGETVVTVGRGPLRTRVDGIWCGLRRVARTTTARAGRRVRTRWRSALSRAARMTGATVAAFVVAELVGLREPPPLIAALTALLVVQATLASTLVNGVQRVLSVVAGLPSPFCLCRSLG